MIKPIALAIFAAIMLAGCGPSNTDTDLLEECIATCIESGGTRWSCQGDCTNGDHSTSNETGEDF